MGLDNLLTVSGHNLLPGRFQIGLISIVTRRVHYTSSNKCLELTQQAKKTTIVANL